MAVPMQMISEGFRLSPQQRRLWAVQEGDPLPYRVQYAVRLAGDLEVQACRAALERAAARHEILSTTFRRLPGLDLPLQVIAGGGVAWEGDEDWRGLDRDRQETLLAELFDSTGRLPFDLEDGPMLRARLIALAPRDHLLLLALPALAADPASVANLVRETGRCYAGRPGGEPAEEPLQYPDLAAWQNDLLEAEDKAAGREYWQGRDLSSAWRLELPFATRPAARPAFLPALRRADVPLETAAGLAALARRLEAPLPILLESLWALLLARRTGAEEVTVASAYAGRKHPELESALGPLARFLPVQCRPDGRRKLADFVRSVAEAASEVSRWQEFFDGPHFFPFCFEFEERSVEPFAPGIQWSFARGFACIDRFEAKLSCLREGDRLSTELHYDASLLQAPEADRLMQSLHRLLASTVAAPEAPLGRLDILGEEERHRLLCELSRTRTEARRERTVHAGFEELAAAHPETDAVICGDRRLSYGELNGRANQLARWLRARGVGPGAFVPLFLERSAEMLVAILGVLKSGAAYVALDPLSPRARLLAMLSDLDAPLLITETSLEPDLPDHGLPVLRLDAEPELECQGREDLGQNPQPEDAAYALFTSGSTGGPKAVVVEHRQLFHYVQSILPALDLAPGWSFAVVSTFAADLGHTAIFPTLGSGGCVHVIAQPSASDPAALAEVFRRHPIDCLKIVPSHLEALLAASGAADLLPRRRLVLGGEAASWNLMGKIRALGPRCEIFNHYGPTEATVGAATYRLDREAALGSTARVPLGRPIANAEIYLLDSWGNPVSLGAPGELCIAGAGLARGYLGRAELTAERFIPHAFAASPGQRLYRTGDLARYLADGNLEFLGRIDDQVKIRGFRVELREIESVLAEHPGIERAVVLWRTDPEPPRLVAHLVPDGARASAVLRLLRLQGDSSSGGSLYELPNGLTVHHLNRGETAFLFQEIFAGETYLRHGIRLEDGACVFDVGAHIGLFSLFVAQRCPDATIYAFEPLPPTFETLRRNADLHGLNMKLFQCGLADVAGDQAFTFYPHVSLMSSRYANKGQERDVVRSFLLADGEAGGAPDGALLDELLQDRLQAESIICPLRTLSDVIREQRVDRIDLLKVDVQKSELDVLHGIAEEDWRKIRQIVIEVHDIEGRLGAVQALLTRAGYQVTAEQERVLGDTCLYQVYAVRPTDGPQGPMPARPAARREDLPSWTSPDRLREDLRAWARERLPEFMVPASFVLLAALPLNPNGKVDRRRLAALVEEERTPVEEHVAPRTPVEEMLAGLWAELLSLPRVGIHQSFFEIGGHSLLATRLVSRVREAFGVEVPLRRLFDQPTVAGLAESLEAGLRERQPGGVPPLERVPRDRPLPLSFAQQRLWFLHEMKPDVPAYNVHFALRLIGALDVSVLQAAFSEIVKRHEVLRTTFELVDGQPVQRIALPRPVRVDRVDLAALPEPVRESAVLAWTQSEARHCFDLGRGPLLRMVLLQLGDEEHVLLVTMHHIVTDGWSNVVLSREFAALYEALSAGRTPVLPEVPIQYADFASWQRGWLQGEVLEQQLSYWRKQLGGDPPLLELPTDRPRPRRKSWCGGRERIELSATLSEALRALSRREDVTLFMLLLAALKTLLYRYTGQEDVIVGCGIANRPRAELEGLIGFFVNTLALRTDLSNNPTFRELLARVREVTLGAYTHQDLPFEKIIEELQPERQGYHAPLCRVMFALQNVPGEGLPLAELRVAPLATGTGTSKSDLMFTLRDSAAGLAGSMEYDADLFEGSSIVRLLAHFSAILEGVVSDPEVRLLDIPLGEDLAAHAADDAEDRFLFDG